MAKVNSDETASLELRGMMPVDHPLYGQCKTVPPRAAFKVLMTLAENAATTKKVLDDLVVGDHPFGASLRKMNSHDALVYLIGITRILALGASELKPVGSTSSQTGAAALIQPSTQLHIDASAPESRLRATSDEMEFDDEEFELLSGKPA